LTLPNDSTCALLIALTPRGHPERSSNRLRPILQAQRMETFLQLKSFMSQSNRQRLKARIATAPTRAQKQAPHSPRTPVTAKQLWQQEAQCIGARAVCFINVRPKKARSVQKCQLEPPTEERKHMDIMCTAKKIAECYRRAMEAGQFFENSTDPVAKNEFREIQRKWLSLARNCKCMSEEAQKPSRRSTHAPRRTPR
jgi:hypothetical protein